MNAIQNFRADTDKTRQGSIETGSVTLVGAGPGAADLLTVRAVRVLEKADAVYYDSLVDDAVLDLIPAQAKRVFVGKRKGFSAMPQHHIQDKLRDDALAGLHVVRLKGGDPFIFGRGGEEVLDLEAKGIAVVVVPGVTTAIAAAAEHGIPLTHRNVATSVIFATGHSVDQQIPDVDGFDPANQTLVIYMGVSSAEEITQKLIGKGVAASVPLAVIERATLPGQRLIRSSLGSLSSDIAAHDIVAPALIIIGQVTALRASRDELFLSETSALPPNESFEWVHHPLG